MKPKLTLIVEASCPACDRARRALLGSPELLEVADVVITDLSTHAGELPSSFVGVPTTVFEGRVVALGTPDCEELVRLVRASVNGDGKP